ncbi:MAG: alpha-glucan family phosphorylase [Bacteroidia bacterium]|nr:alpha-glucan family phosphorylase [Bacteroidia bacterium]
MDSSYKKWYLPYTPDNQYSKRVAYFSMEFAVDQPLKIYSGGLGFLAGSHMRSAYELKQNLIGIGMLWKYGYYDQVRDEEGFMRPQFVRKNYPYLIDTGIKVTVEVNKHPVHVKAFCLPCETFNSVPIYLLSTDLPENDHLARTITERLYDGNTLTRIAQQIVLGVGGAKVVEALGGTDIYHMNESHALPLVFHLYQKFGKSVDAVKEKFVFTTHTPEKAGNEEHNIHDLDNLSFFGNLTLDEVRSITGMHGDTFGHTPAALHLAKIANGVSQMHAEVSIDMWKAYPGICNIIGITNAQNYTYWADKSMYEALSRNDSAYILLRKREKKLDAFRIVADQCGKLFDPNVFTIVWARRFAGYKRADLLLRDLDRMEAFLNNPDFPVQIIWAGKPYPLDEHGISIFNHLVEYSRNRKNVAVLTGYELHLSRKLKEAADVWLNTPRITREASGTSGMTAAMNGAVSVSIPDGWIPEFAKNGHNCFITPVTDHHLPITDQDDIDYENFMSLFNDTILPMYYKNPNQWAEIMKNALRDVIPMFDSGRMAREYYERMYNL